MLKTQSASRIENTYDTALWHSLRSRETSSDAAAAAANLGIADMYKYASATRGAVDGAGGKFGFLEVPKPRRNRSRAGGAMRWHALTCP